MTISKVLPRMIGALLCLLLLVATAAASNYTVIPRAADPPAEKQFLPKGPDDHTYQGYLRVFIIQDSSTHWNDFAGRPYRFACIAIPVDDWVTIAYTDTIEYDIVWDPAANGFGDVTEDNVSVIGYITDHRGYERDSNFPYNPEGPHGPFQAYFPQRVVHAWPGETVTDPASGDFTHSILVEVGTSSTCPACPATANGLRYLYEGDAYPFHYVSLVTSLPAANAFITDVYNQIFLPTGYVNGGWYVQVGGTADTALWAGLVRDAGALTVEDVFLEVSLEWLRGELEIGVRAAKSGLTNNAPGSAETPSGDTDLWEPETGTYTTSCVESEGDQVYFKWVWEEGDTSDWLGPYDSGAPCEVTHQWGTGGVYAVKVLVKDQFDAEGPWSDPLTVTVYVVVCGDADGNAIINISDAVKLIGYIFGGDPPPDPYIAGDADCNLIVNVSDAVYLIAYIFGGGPVPCADCP